jgi:WbqC-like protein
MKMAVMQPYFCPYIGYFQLVGAVDVFVFFDDVNFIKKGWINRNQILQQDSPQAFTIPLTGATQNKRIDETLLFGYPAWREKFLKTLETNYRKAPCFDEAYEQIKQMLFSQEFRTIRDLAAESIMVIARHIGLTTRFSFSSSLDYTGTGGQAKILDICRIVGAEAYINPVNGAFLYDPAAFADNHVELFFLEPSITAYRQFASESFVPRLSIIDVLMFNKTENVLAMAREHKLQNGQRP